MRTAKQILKTAIPFAATILFLYLAFANIDLAHLWSSLRDTESIVLLIAGAMAVLSMVLRSWRWQVLLAPVRSAPFAAVFSANMIGFMANNVLPARIGELIRPYLLARKERMDVLSVISTVVLERLFDGITLALMLCVVLVLIPVPTVILYGGSAIGGASIFAMMLLMLLAANRFDLRARLLRLAERLPERFRKTAVERTKTFLAGLHVLRSWRSVLILLGLSFVVWLQMTSIIYYVLLEFPFTGEAAAESNLMLASLTVLVFLAFGVALPSSPGYVGITQLVFKVGLALFAIDASEAVAASIVFHVTQYVPVTVIGLLLLMRSGIRLKSLAARPEQ